jgi:hypothetical protein
VGDRGQRLDGRRQALERGVVVGEDVVERSIAVAA